MKKSSPHKVSVIMGAYNTSKYIGECIESVLGQTFKDFEFIIVNDCSTDNTLDIIKKYDDKRIIIINNKKNVGVAESLNKGIRIAKGKYIAIMDSDDIMMPERLKTTYDYLEKNKKVFLVGGAVYFMDNTDKIIGKNIPTSGSENIKKRLMIRSSLWHFTTMFRNDKKTFYRGKFRYSQDYDFHTLLITKGKRLENIKQILAKYRIHNTSTSYSKRTRQDMFADKVREFYIQRLKTGKDSYNKFNPADIMNFDPEKTKDRQILINESKAHWISKDYVGARRFSAKYIKNHGLFSKLTLYYIASYMPEYMINLYRRIKKVLRGNNG